MNQAQEASGPRARRRGKPRENPTPKAGRNLPAATVVGVGMLVCVLGGLLFLPLGFVLITMTFAIFGVWEVFRALEAAGTRVPIVPVMVGT
ncbi:MAG: phosphatidate cytidylyltransferase, partial [Arthrobacter sp.]